MKLVKVHFKVASMGRDEVLFRVGGWRGLGYSPYWQRRVKHQWLCSGCCCRRIPQVEVSWTGYCVGSYSKSRGTVQEFD